MATAGPQLSTKKVGEDPRDHATCHALEGIIGKVLHPSNMLSPEQLHDIMEMFLTDLHLRKVGGEFWVETCNKVMDLARVAVEVRTLGHIIKTLDLDEAKKKVLDDMMKLSIAESSEKRHALLPVINLLKEMKCPGETVH